MEKCYFKVGETYYDEYRNKFTITDVRPHFPHRSTFDNSVTELPEGCENYYDIFTNEPHKPFWGEEYPNEFKSFAQNSIKYKQLVEINDNPNKKDLICVVTGAKIICDRLEYNSHTNDMYKYAMFWNDWTDVKYYNLDRLTKEEKKELFVMVERLRKSSRHTVHV